MRPNYPLPHNRTVGDGLGLTCKPTEADALGPFYKPDAPVRYRVGKGYVLTGTVRSASDCRPIRGSRIELWMAGPEGEYADAYRATLFTESTGAFFLKAISFPPITVDHSIFTCAFQLRDSVRSSPSIIRTKAEQRRFLTSS